MDWTAILAPSLQNNLDEILAQAATDFTTNQRGYFSENDLQKILTKARERLYQKLQQHPAHTYSDLAQAWNQVVSDFYGHQNWGFQTQAEPPPKAAKPRADNHELVTYLRMFLVPTLALKSSLLYFGLKYSANPGDGYGWGLVAAIVLSVINFSFFLWKTRGSSEE